MNILFLTMNNFSDISEHSIYPDIIRALSNKGHSVTVLTPLEKKLKTKTNLTVENKVSVIRVRTGNLFNVGMITKLVSRSFLCYNYWKPIKQLIPQTKFHLILFTTPPTNLTPIVYKIKKRDGAYVYLMLKDIFPQNAVDMGMIGQDGLPFKLFRHIERKMYKVADKIGCMSPANVDYLLKQDSWLPPSKVEVCPNAIEVRPYTSVDKNAIRKQFGLPKDKIIFIYGGSLGKPQGIDFFLNCIEETKDHSVFFAVAGSGPYINKIKSISDKYPNKIKLLPWLPVVEYESLVKACDVGLIFLDYRFRIPNFPSRLLNYMEFGLPILAATDVNTDIGKIVQDNGFGYWCESNKVDAFIYCIDKFKNETKRREMGDKARSYLSKNYSADIVVKNILRHVEDKN